MALQKKLKFDVNLEYVFCGLYTLSEFDSFFQKLNLKTNNFLSNKNEIIELTNLKNFSELENVLNNRDLRIFSYILLTPLRKKEYFNPPFSNTGILDEEICDEIILLKRYLRKFKYTYFKYFNCQTGAPHPFYTPTVKELNFVAIKFLFLLIGI